MWQFSKLKVFRFLAARAFNTFEVFQFLPREHSTLMKFFNFWPRDCYKVLKFFDFWPLAHSTLLRFFEFWPWEQIAWSLIFKLLFSYSQKQVSVLFYRLFEHLETTLKSFLDTKELFEKSRLKADKETLVKMTRVILQDLLWCLDSTSQLTMIWRLLQGCHQPFVYSMGSSTFFSPNNQKVPKLLLLNSHNNNSKEKIAVILKLASVLLVIGANC